MKNKIGNNAIKILKYLIDNDVLADNAIKLQELYNSIDLSEKEFNSVDTYLLQQKYIDGTLGGMNGTRWLTARGIEFYEVNSTILETDYNNQEDKYMINKKKVYVIHGRDNNLRKDFFSFLRSLGLDPIEWSEAIKLTGKATPYVYETIKNAFKKAQAVIVLLSPDDEVRLSPELWKDKEDPNEKKYQMQARPNVLFEAGMAFGTNPDRTIFIEIGQIKKFSDISGFHTIRIINSSNKEKRNEIAERLITAGCDVSKSGNDWLNIGNFNVIRDIKNKHNNSPQIIKQNKTLKEAEYKPSKEEIQILLQFKNGKILSLANLRILKIFSIDKTDLYFNNLLSNIFIKYHQETNYQDELDSILGNKRYELSQKGREFLLSNNSLD